MTSPTRPLIAVAIAFLVSACSSASPTLTPQPQVTLSAVDSAFIQGAGQASNAEIAAAKLAEQKSQNADVIGFAQQMITDHTAENAALAPVATAAGTTAPNGVNAMQQATAQTLMALAGTAFDAAYVNSEISGHQMNLSTNYEPEISTGSNTSVVAYAKKYQPQVAMHLQMVQAIKAKYNFEGTPAPSKSLPSRGQSLRRLCESLRTRIALRLPSLLGPACFWQCASQGSAS